MVYPLPWGDTLSLKPVVDCLVHRLDILYTLCYSNGRDKKPKEAKQMTTTKELEPVTLSQCRAELAKLVRQYPQYQGKLIAWIQATAAKDYSTKGGVAMVKGDTILVDPDSYEIGGRHGKPRPFMLIWSARRRGFVMVDKRKIMITTKEIK
jgi:hypothetical protein